MPPKIKRKNIMLDPVFHRQVKTAAAVHGMTMQDLLKAVFAGAIHIEIEVQHKQKGN